jgi:FdhE protein
MTDPIESSLKELERQRPEWEPWLAVVQEVIDESADARWDATVPASGEARESKVPLLAGAALTVDSGLLGRWVERLFCAAGASGTSEMATLKPALLAASDIFSLFKAALCQDGARLKETAASLGADPEAFQAVAALLPVPLLHAYRRQWTASIARSWSEGYCPVCGAWPAFAEARGIERSRYLRCGRCAGEWEIHVLTCPYCGLTDHEQLATLVPENGGPTRVVEACKRCLGYVKVFTTLQASPAGKVMLDDLASVDLDVAALEKGYRRPQGPGYNLDVTLVEKRAGSGKFFSWRS